MFKRKSIAFSCFLMLECVYKYVHELKDRLQSRSCSLVMSGTVPEVCGDLPVEKAGPWQFSGQALVDISEKK